MCILGNQDYIIVNVDGQFVPTSGKHIFHLGTSPNICLIAECWRDEPSCTRYSCFVCKVRESWVNSHDLQLNSQAGAVTDAAVQARVCSNADGKSVYLLVKQLAGDCPQDWLSRISADTPADAQLKIEHEIIGAVALVDGFPWSLFPLRQQTHVWCNLPGCSPGLISHCPSIQYVGCQSANVTYVCGHAWTFPG